MNELIAIPDPLVALIVTELHTDSTGRIHHRAAGLRRRRRRFEQAARLRRLLA